MPHGIYMASAYVVYDKVGKCAANVLPCVVWTHADHYANYCLEFRKACGLHLQPVGAVANFQRQFRFL